MSLMLTDFGLCGSHTPNVAVQRHPEKVTTLLEAPRRMSGRKLCAALQHAGVTELTGGNFAQKMDFDDEVSVLDDSSFVFIPPPLVRCRVQGSTRSTLACRYVDALTLPLQELTLGC